MNDKELQDKQLQEQNEKVASRDDFPVYWIDRISLFLSHTIKYLIPVIVLVMMYEIFMRYIMEKPTMWVNELCLWLAGICYLVGGIYATRLRSHIRIVLLYDYVSRPTQRIFDLISTIVIGYKIWYGKIKKIKEYSFEKEWFVSELLISLGMIGTVIGFIFMLYSVFVDLNIEDAQAVQESLGGMAQGMGTALLTTLVGLIGSVLIKSQLVMVEDEKIQQ